MSVSSPEPEAARRLQVQLTPEQADLLGARGAVRGFDGPTSQSELDPQFIQRCIGTYLDIESLVRDGGQLLVRLPGEGLKPLQLDFSEPPRADRIRFAVPPPI